ncbi:hypothetical protein [Achromobacter aegrifaciens]
MSTAFDGIRLALLEALAHAKGQANGVRVHILPEIDAAKQDARMAPGNGKTVSHD